MSDGNEFATRYGYWGEHPEYPAKDWVYEVNAQYTRLGYWEWVAALAAVEMEERGEAEEDRGDA